VTFLSTVLLTATGVLALAAAVRLRTRLREPLVRPSLLDDDAIRTIEVTGSVEIDDELDPAAIEEEERRFWEEEEWE
jgi:hypothetical protein